MTESNRPPAAAEPPEPAILADPLAGDPALRLLLDRVRDAVPASAPPPSAELLAALADVRLGTAAAATADATGDATGDVAAAVPLSPRRHRYRARTPRYHKVLLAVAGAAAVAIPATGVAAANNGLPNPAERVVSRVVNDWTPFTIDSSDDPATPVHRLPSPPTGSRPTGPGRVASTEPTEPAGSSTPSREPSEDRGQPEPTGTARPSTGGAESEPTDPIGSRARTGSPDRSTSPSPSHTRDD